MKYILFILSVSCAHKALTEKEQSVRILLASDASLKCEQKGSFDASWEALVTANKEDLLKSKTSAMGGNVLQVTMKDKYGQPVGGMVFNCPSE